MKRIAGYVAVFVLGFIACAGILQVMRGREAPRERLAASFVTESRPVRSDSGLPSVAEAAARVEPSVVNIDITGVQRGGRGPLAFLRPHSMEEFEGSGSGIILTPDGYVVTNNHVIEPVAKGDSGEIIIKLDNGKEYNRVSIVGRDPQTDLAVLKINGASNLPTARLGDSDNLRVGDWAIAVGNPLGFNSTVTLGIISALNRNYARSDTVALDRVIQTDAAINPGNSGGALADIGGRVIGINTAIASQNGGSVGIGFAIPINVVKRIAEQLIQEGKVTRPYLGISYAPMDAVERGSLPREIVLPDGGQGMVVVSGPRGGQAVVPGSPADRAGIREYDVILEIDGKPITDQRTIKDEVQNRKVGEQVTLKIWREGRTQDVAVTLDRMPDDYGRLTRPRRSVQELPYLTPENEGWE